MAYSGKVISGDCHVDITWLPEDTFTSRAPAHLDENVVQKIVCGNTAKLHGFQV